VPSARAVSCDATHSACLSTVTRAAQLPTNCPGEPESEPLTKRPSARLLAVLLAAGMASPLSLAGCYNRYDVVPTELVKLSGTRSVSATVSGSSVSYDSNGASHLRPTSGTVQAEESIKLVRTDGGVAMVRGDADVEISAGMQIHRFRHPVMAELQGNRLVIRGDNGGQAFPLANVSSATVVTKDEAKTQLATMSIAAAAGLLVVGILWATLRSDRSY